MTTVVLTSSDAAWSWPAGVTSITAEAIGGGGAGGNATNNPAGGGGGKGGSYAKATITKGAETTLNVTVGAGGSSGAVNGTASTIVQNGTTVLSAAGGNGVAPNSLTGASTLNGSNVGDTTFTGGNGGNGVSGGTSGAGGGAGGPTGAGGAGSGGSSGAAGSGSFADGTARSGAGGAGVSVRNAGNAGGIYGAGGSGGSTNQNTDRLGGAGAQGVVVITYTMPAISTLTDNFDDGTIDTSKWTVSDDTNATSTEQNGVLEQTPTGTNAAYALLDSVDSYNLLGSEIVIRVHAHAPLAGNREQFLQLNDAAGSANRIRFVIADGSIYGSVWNADVEGANSFNVTYNAADHAWWRFRGDLDGTVYWDTAPSSASNPPTSGEWVNQGSKAYSSGIAWLANDVFVRIACGQSVSGAALTTPASWDGLNSASNAASGVTGALAASESGADVAAVAGTVAVSGGAAAAESGADTFAAAGTLTSLAIGALTDDFDAAIDSNKWTASAANGGSVAATGGVLDISPAAVEASDAGIDTVGAYSLEGSEIYVQMVRPLLTNSGTEDGFTFFRVKDNADNGNTVEWLVSSIGNLIARVNALGTPDGSDVTVGTWSDTDHKWLKIAMSGGTVTWSTAPDSGSGTPGTWTVQRTDSSVPSTFTSVRANLLAIWYGPTGAVTQTAQFDGLNTAANNPGVSGSLAAAETGADNFTASGDPVSLLFAGGAVGFNLEPSPPSHFTEGGTALTGYSTYNYANPTTYDHLADTWLDSSPNGKNLVNPGAPSDPIYVLEGASPGQMAGERWGNTDYGLIAGIGGATSAFYLAAALTPDGYYGTLFSDANGNTGFRLRHDADVGLIYFSAGTGSSRVEISASSRQPTLFQNGDTPVVVEAWYDGADIFLRTNNGPISSAAVASVSAGNADMLVGRLDAGGTDLTMVRLFQACCTKNHCPDQATRDAIYPVLAAAMGLAGVQASSESGDDILDATGFPSYDGAAALVEANTPDNFAADGIVTVTGAAAGTEDASDSFASSGVLPIEGDLGTAEEGADSFSSAGTIEVAGSLDAAEAGGDSFAAAGGMAISGTVSATETTGDSFAAAGAVKVAGALAASEAAADLMAAAGGVAVAGAMAAAETGADTFGGNLPHAYWRVYVTNTNAGNAVCCAELEFRATVGGADQTSGGTPIASSYDHGGFGAAARPPADAFDNNASSFWSSGTIVGPWWIGYQFAAAVNVHQVSWLVRSTRSDFSPEDFSVDYSDDGVTWFTAWSVSGQAGWLNSEQRLFTDPSPVAGGKVLVTGTLAAVESGADVFASTGDSSIAGTMDAVEQSSDIANIEGGGPITGELALVEPQDDSFAGTATVLVWGNFTALELQQDSFAADGVLSVAGTADMVESGADSLSGSGKVSQAGSMSAIEAATPDSFFALGKVAIAGAMAPTEAPDIFNVTGSVPAVGALAVAESAADDVFAATGSVWTEGSLAAVENPEPDTFASSGLRWLSSSLQARETGADDFDATGVLPISGAVAASEHPDIYDIRGSVPATGAMGASERPVPDSVLVLGKVRVAGAMSAAEDPTPDTFLGNLGKVFIAGRMAASEDPDSLYAEGEVFTTGEAPMSELAPDLMDAQGDVLVQGAAAGVETGADGAAMAGHVLIAGALAASEQGQDSVGLIEGFITAGHHTPGFFFGNPF